MKSSKQTNIASFFGAKPKTTGAAAPKAEGEAAAAAEAASPAPEAKPAQAAAAAAAGGEGKKLKRLRKAGSEEPAKQAAAALPSELEDADAPAAAAGPAAASPARRSPSPAKGRKRKQEAAPASPLGSLKTEPQVAAAIEEAAAAAVAEAEEEEAELSSGVSEEDGEGEEAGPSKARKPAAKKTKKANGSKMDGVGTGAVKAAALHASFDLAQLVTWEAGKPVPFSFLADTFEAIAEESKRLAITHMLINAFRAVIATTPGDLLPMVYLCTNRVAPAHEGVELGIGDATLIKALSTATGTKEASIKAAYDKQGDIGEVAASFRSTQRTLFTPPPLTVAGVFGSFTDIARCEGAKSQDRKRNLIVKLLAAAKGGEAGYVMRALQGKLRIGLAEQTVLVALAHAVALQRDGAAGAHEAVADRLETAAQAVKACYSECPSYDELVPALLELPVEQLHTRVHFKPGVPVKPMLAKPTTGVTEVLDKFTDAEFTVEYKYDGERAQVHVTPDGAVRIYSRNSEDNTPKYPDIAALVPRALAPGVTSVVLDAEAVAVDRATGKVLPFQVLSTRARKGVEVEAITVQVCVYAFDCLYLNGRTLLREPLTVRREALLSAFTPIPGEIEFAAAKTSRDVEELTTFLEDAVEAGTEGLIVKTLGDSYEPSRRSSHWLKLKKDYMEGVGDSFDLVPIGAWHGRGKRVGMYGSYLLAAYDPEGEEYQTICKIGTGFSEELLKSLTAEMEGIALGEPKKYYRYGEGLVPDVWFEPKTVWEVRAADLSLSPVHRAAAGLVDPARGISIRFPRLLRVRDDKGPEDATTAEQVAEMYSAQAVLNQGGGGGGGGDDE